MQHYDIWDIIFETRFTSVCWFSEDAWRDQSMNGTSIIAPAKNARVTGQKHSGWTSLPRDLIYTNVIHIKNTTHSSIYSDFGNLGLETPALLCLEVSIWKPRAV